MVRGHGKGVDWWALGAIVRDGHGWSAAHHRPQLQAAVRPAAECALQGDPRQEVPLLSEPAEQELCDVVRGLLRWDALNRLGCLTDSAKDVMGHPFFAAEDWDSLMAQTRPPPFVRSSRCRRHVAL